MRDACGESGIQNLKSWDGDRKVPVPLLDHPLLGHYLAENVPRKHQKCVWLSFVNRGWRQYRDVRPGQEFSLLGLGGIANVAEQVRLDASIVQQRVALCRGSV